MSARGNSFVGRAETDRGGNLIREAQLDLAKALVEWLPLWRCHAWKTGAESRPSECRVLSIVNLAEDSRLATHSNLSKGPDGGKRVRESRPCD